jgi:molecular chaperone GrpE
LSKKARKQPGPVVDAPGESDDHDGPALAPNPELEAALREAVDAADAAADAVEPETDTDIETDIDPKRREEASEDLPPGESVDEELKRIRDELVQSQDKQLRLQADFENFRRRALKERQELLQYGHENLVKDLLSTVDNLDRAIEHTQQSDGGDLESLLRGVEMLQRELYAILERHAVSEIEAMGGAFDPALHEAMAQVADASVAPNTVIDVLQKGYQLRGRLLRPARVVVAREPEENEIDGGDTG